MGEKHQGGTNSVVMSALAAVGAMAFAYLTIEVGFKPLLDRLRQSFPKSSTKGGEDVEITNGGKEVDVEEEEKEVKVELHGVEKAKEEEVKVELHGVEKAKEEEVEVEKTDEECAGEAKGEDVEIEKVDNKEEGEEIVEGDEMGVEVVEGKPDKEDEVEEGKNLVKEAEVEVEVLPSSPASITSSADPQQPTPSSSDVHKDGEDDASAMNFTTVQVETEK